MSSNECKRFRNAIEQAVETAALPAAQKEHLAACPACQSAADDISATRAFLSDMPRAAAQPAPWFAPRVMAAIAAGESEMRRSLEAWAAVPRLAARLTWVSALALVLASTWLYATPNSNQNSRSQTTVESLFDSTQSAQADDVLPAVERGE
jgi:predicted anti-sigma-YlaC factor YlaD